MSKNTSTTIEPGSSGRVATVTLVLTVPNFTVADYSDTGTLLFRGSYTWGKTCQPAVSNFLLSQGSSNTLRLLNEALLNGTKSARILATAWQPRNSGVECANRASFTVIRKHPAPALRRNGACRLVLDRGAGPARTRRYFVRQRRLGDGGGAGCSLRTRVAAGSGLPGPAGVPHDHVGSSLPARGPIRRDSLSRRLLAFCRLAMPACSSTDHAARTAGSSRVVPGVSSIPGDAAGINFGRSAPAAAMGQLAGNDLSRIAREPVLARASSRPVSGISRPHFAGEARGPRN